MFEDLFVDIDLSQFDRIKLFYVCDYNNIDVFFGDIDLYVGGISENLQVGFILGQIFICIIVRIFQRYCFGDCFWYECDDFNIGFILEQLDFIR